MLFCGNFGYPSVMAAAELAAQNSCTSVRPMMAPIALVVCVEVENAISFSSCGASRDVAVRIACQG